MAKFSETQAEVEESSIMECLHEKLSFSQRLQDMSRGLKIQIAVVLCFLLLGVLYFADRPQGRAKKRINCVVGDSIPISSDPLKENSRFANEPSVDVGLPAYLMNDLLRAFRDGKADGYVLRTTLGVYEAQLFQDELVFQTQAEYLFEASGFEQIYAEHSHVCLPFRFIKTDMVIDSGSDRQFRAIFKSEAEEDVVWALKGSCFAYKTGRSHELIPFLYLDDPSATRLFLCVKASPNLYQSLDRVVG